MGKYNRKMLRVHSSAEKHRPIYGGNEQRIVNPSELIKGMENMKMKKEIFEVEKAKTDKGLIEMEK